MRYVLYFLIYVYVFTGIFIAAEIPFKHIIARVLMMIWFSIFWLPIVLSKIIINHVR